MCAFNSIEGNIWKLLKQMDKVLYKVLYMCVCVYTYIYIVRALPGVCGLWCGHWYTYAYEKSAP